MRSIKKFALKNLAGGETVKKASIGTEINGHFR